MSKEGRARVAVTERTQKETRNSEIHTVVKYLSYTNVVVV